MTPPTAETPEFEVVPVPEAERRKPARRPRRNWKPVLDALVAGRSLFMTDDDVSDSNVKYLVLCLYRRGKDERLRTARMTRGGRDGRLLWVAGTTTATTPATEVVSV